MQNEIIFEYFKYIYQPKTVFGEACGSDIKKTLLSNVYN